MERYGGKAREKDHPTEVFIKYPNFVPISLLSVKFVSMFFVSETIWICVLAVYCVRRYLLHLAAPFFWLSPVFGGSNCLKDHLFQANAEKDGAMSSVKAFNEGLKAALAQAVEEQGLLEMMTDVVDSWVQNFKADTWQLAG